MGKIAVLDKTTVDRIAAGEAVERPAAVAKELVENSIDAGARAVTVEIKDGGITYLRVTDDGSGIAPEDVRTAFLRHATSKIREAEDLEAISSLGFRGEALASIAAVSRVELITKRAEDLAGTRYIIEGGDEKKLEEIGAPDGTTFIVRDLFYNTPARQKFLKTAMTEGAYIGSYIEQLALSNPDISFQFIVNGQMKLQSSGSGAVRDVIYAVFGRTIVQELLAVDSKTDAVHVHGWIAKPSVFRSNRNYENYYVNGRYVKSRILSKAIEDGFASKLMQHCYPFTCLMIDIDPAAVDVNVHPAKMDVRFSEEKTVYDAVMTAVRDTIRGSEMIVPATIGKPETVHVSAAERKEERKAAAEPFEYKRREEQRQTEQLHTEQLQAEQPGPAPSMLRESGYYGVPMKEKPEQISFLTPEAKKKRKVIGQAFSTYWIIEFGDELLLIDQHAAHEKVLYERLMKQYADAQVIAQPLMPPTVISTDAHERLLLSQYADAFDALGFEIEPFGDTEYKISSIPYNLSGADVKVLFQDILNSVEEDKKVRDLPSYVHEIATEACKAAIKGGGEISLMEAEALLDELMQCEDPYHCPHGRPTIISMTKRELEKKFKRIV